MILDDVIVALKTIVKHSNGVFGRHLVLVSSVALHTSWRCKMALAPITL